MRVILAVNDPKHALRVASGALEFGICHNDEVAIITVVTSPGPPSWSLMPPPMIADIDEELDLAARDSMRKASLALQTSLHSEHIHEFKLYGKLDEELKHFVQSWQADLVVIGFHDNKPGTDHMQRIVEACPCPVLIVGRDSDDANAEKKSAFWKEPSYII